MSLDTESLRIPSSLGGYHAYAVILRRSVLAYAVILGRKPCILRCFWAWRTRVYHCKGCSIILICGRRRARRPQVRYCLWTRRCPCVRCCSWAWCCSCVRHCPLAQHPPVCSCPWVWHPCVCRCPWARHPCISRCPWVRRPCIRHYPRARRHCPWVRRPLIRCCPLGRRHHCFFPWRRSLPPPSVAERRSSGHAFSSLAGMEPCHYCFPWQPYYLPNPLPSKAAMATHHSPCRDRARPLVLPLAAGLPPPTVAEQNISGLASFPIAEMEHGHSAASLQ